jgi:hypothetical protein
MKIIRTKGITRQILFFLMRKNPVLSRPGREDSWTTKINRVRLLPPAAAEDRASDAAHDLAADLAPDRADDALGHRLKQSLADQPTGRDERGSGGSGILSRGVNLERKTLSNGRREDPAGHSWN